MIKNTAPCWDSSILCAFAEPFTIKVTAISAMAGERSASIISQFIPGTTVLNGKNIFACHIPMNF